MTAGPYTTIDFTETFLTTLSSRDFSPAERTLFLKALRLLDADERHPSLRVHPLRGDRCLPRMTARHDGDRTGIYP